VAGNRLKATDELLGKEMMISYLIEITPWLPSSFHSARTSSVAPGNGTCQPAPACPFALTSHPFLCNLWGRNYHNVLFKVKCFYCILSVLLFCGAIKHQVRKYFTRLANLHLLLPTLLHHTFTDCSVYKPAKISGLELPGRTLLPLVRGTFFGHPARFAAFTIRIHPGDKEIHLPFHRGRYWSPCLFVAVNSLYRGAEQLSHLLLGLVQFFAEMDELFAVHGEFRESVTWTEKRYVEPDCHNVACMSTEKIPLSLCRFPK